MDTAIEMRCAILACGSHGPPWRSTPGLHWPASTPRTQRYSNLVFRCCLAALAAVVLLATPLSSGAEGVDFGALLQQPKPSYSSADWLRDPSGPEEALSATDQLQLEQQRQLARAAARKHFGVALQGNRGDLHVLQRLIDERVFARHARYELQSLGVVFGDVLVGEYGYKWIVWSDELGRSRALRHPTSGRVIFPVTAISRRIEGGVEVQVMAIFDSLAPDGLRSASTSSTSSANGG